jgi:hypothetical protein
MYYLVITNMNIEKCIDTNSEDIYVDGFEYNCLRSFPYMKTHYVKGIAIYCKGDHSGPVDATVYRD